MGRVLTDLIKCDFDLMSHQDRPMIVSFWRLPTLVTWKDPPTKNCLHVPAAPGAREAVQGEQVLVQVSSVLQVQVQVQVQVQDVWRYPFIWVSSTQIKIGFWFSRWGSKSSDVINSEIFNHSCYWKAKQTTTMATGGKWCMEVSWSQSCKALK